MTAWVLVTGGAVRLGREFCLAFARAGWGVACHYRHSASDAQALADGIIAAGGKAITVQGPLDCAAHASDVFDQVVRHCGGAPQAVVNNASLFEADTAGTFTEEAMLAQLRTNLVVPLTFGKLLHGNRTDGGGAMPAVLIHVLDQKVYNLNPDYFSYTLSKLALERAVTQQAQALAPLVRVNAVAPGLLYPSGPQTAENFALASHANLLRRPIDPAQVAQAALFLASNPCVTGVSVTVDNGQHLVPVERDIMFVVDELLKDLRK